MQVMKTDAESVLCKMQILTLKTIKFVRYLFKNLSPVDTVWRLMAGNRGERFSYRVESYIWLKRTEVSESDPECIVS